MQFGEKLKSLRSERNITQVDLAKAIGVSRRTYIAYEQEGRYPRKREVYFKLAEVLGCDPNYLLTEDEDFIVSAAEQHGSRGKRQAAQLINELSGLFAGGELADEDKDEMMRAIQEAYWIAKENNRKFTRKDYRSEE